MRMLKDVIVGLDGIVLMYKLLNPRSRRVDEIPNDFA